MESEYIYHVTTLKEWEAARLKNEYTPVNYEQDGFIHCSVEKQIPGVLDRFYKGQTGLVKLKIEKVKLELAIDQKELELITFLREELQTIELI